MAHFVILNENDNDKSPALQPQQQKSATIKFLLDLGACNVLFRKVMQMIVDGIFVSSRLKDPEKLAVSCKQLSRFVMWHCNCLLHRARACIAALVPVSSVSARNMRSLGPRTGQKAASCGLAGSGIRRHLLSMRK